MKMKIIGIFVCMMLIITALSATGATNFQTIRNVWENNDLEFYPSNPVDSNGDIAIAIVAEVTIVDDYYNVLGGAINVGDKFTGKYIYDSGIADSHSDPGVGEYYHNSSLYGIELKAAGFEFKTNQSDVEFMIRIYDDYYQVRDSYALYSHSNLDLSNGLAVTFIAWTLKDSTGNALSSDALPTTAPVLSDWTENNIYICGVNPSNPSQFCIIEATVTKATLSRSRTRNVDFHMQPILNWMFERFPNLFPILRQLLNT